MSELNNQPDILSFPPSSEVDDICYKMIWFTRERKSFISGESINEYSRINYHHVLTKKAYPSFRYYFKNIVILTMQEHLDVHQLPKAKLIERNKGWIVYFQLQQILKAEYYQPQLRDPLNPIAIDYVQALSLRSMDEVEF